MKIYLAKKFKEDFSDRSFVENLISFLAEKGIKVSSIVRDYEKWGEVKLTPSVLMKEAFKKIDEADMVLVEFSEKGVGVGIEIGYAYAQGKRIIVIAKDGSDISTTVQGVAEKIIFYKADAELPSLLESLN